MLKDDWILLYSENDKISECNIEKQLSDSETDDLKLPNHDKDSDNIQVRINSPVHKYENDNIYSFEINHSDDDNNSNDDNQDKSRKIMRYMFLTSCLYVTFIIALPNIMDYFS